MNLWKLTTRQIDNMSYTDFVGTVNQWNVPPWSYNTLSSWINYWRITDQSHVLEIACTTWFSIREIFNITQCSWDGIDISKASTDTATKNQKIYGNWDIDKIQYKNIDAYEFTSDKKYSHIVVWAALKFFPDQNKIIEKITELLKDGWYLLASPFYVDSPVPEDLISEARGVFWITITSESYKDVMSTYNKFEIMHEEKHDIIEESHEEIQYYTKCTIDRATNQWTNCSKEIYEALFNRLVKIKEMSNKLRPYQKYSVLVLRYRENIYPNRFVELF
jgi:SAM-dependent methyltransferase